MNKEDNNLDFTCNYKYEKEKRICDDKISNNPFKRFKLFEKIENIKIDNFDNKLKVDKKIDFEKLNNLEKMKIINQEDHHVKEFLQEITGKKTKNYANILNHQKIDNKTNLNKSLNIDDIKEILNKNNKHNEFENQISRPFQISTSMISDSEEEILKKSNRLAKNILLKDKNKLHINFQTIKKQDDNRLNNFFSRNNERSPHRFLINKSKLDDLNVSMEKTNFLDGNLNKSKEYTKQIENKEYNYSINNHISPVSFLIKKNKKNIVTQKNIFDSDNINSKDYHDSKIYDNKQDKFLNYADQLRDGLIDNKKILDSEEMRKQEHVNNKSGLSIGPKKLSSLQLLNLSPVKKRYQKKENNISDMNKSKNDFSNNIISSKVNSALQSVDDNIIQSHLSQEKDLSRVQISDEIDKTGKNNLKNVNLHYSSTNNKDGYKINKEILRSEKINSTAIKSFQSNNAQDQENKPQSHRDKIISKFKKDLKNSNDFSGEHIEKTENNLNLKSEDGNKKKTKNKMKINRQENPNLNLSKNSYAYPSFNSSFDQNSSLSECDNIQIIMNNNFNNSFKEGTNNMSIATCLKSPHRNVKILEHEKNLYNYPKQKQQNTKKFLNKSFHYEKTINNNNYLNENNISTQIFLNKTVNIDLLEGRESSLTRMINRANMIKKITRMKIEEGLKSQNAKFNDSDNKFLEQAYLKQIYGNLENDEDDYKHEFNDSLLIEDKNFIKNIMNKSNKIDISYLNKKDHSNANYTSNHNPNYIKKKVLYSRLSSPKKNKMDLHQDFFPSPPISPKRLKRTVSEERCEKNNGIKTKEIKKFNECYQNLRCYNKSTNNKDIINLIKISNSENILKSHPEDIINISKRHSEPPQSSTKGKTFQCIGNKNNPLSDNLMNDPNTKYYNETEFSNIEQVHLLVNHNTENLKKDVQDNIIEYPQNQKNTFNTENSKEENELIKINESANLNKVKTISEKILEKKRNLIKNLIVYDSLSEDDDKRINRDTYYLNPKSKVVSFIDCLCVLITIYAITYLPIRMIFFDYVNYVTLFCELFFDFIFFVDLCLGFFTAFYDFEENCITNKSKIISNYWNTFFFPDAIAAIPFNFIIEISEFLKNQNIDYTQNLLNQDFIHTNILRNGIYQETSGNNEYIILDSYNGDNINVYGFLSSNNFRKGYRFLKLIRILKVLKILIKNNFINIIFESKLFSNITKSTELKLLIYYFYFLFISHILSCIYIFLGTIDFPNWIVNIKISDSSFADIYLASLYFNHTTIFTVGYGDILSKNTFERFYNIFLMVIGVMLYSFALSSISNIIKENEDMHKSYNEKKEYLNNLSSKYYLSKSLYDKINRHLIYQNKMNKNNKNDLLNELPMSMRNELIIQMNIEIIKNFNFFKECRTDIEFVIQVIMCFKPTRSMKNEILLKEGDFLEEIIMINSGCLNLYTFHEFQAFDIPDEILECGYIQGNLLQMVKILELRKNEYFGDYLMIENERSPFTIKTKSKNAELFLLSKTDVIRLFHEFTDNFEKIYVKSTHNMIQIKKCILVSKKRMEFLNNKRIKNMILKSSVKSLVNFNPETLKDKKDKILKNVEKINENYDNIEGNKNNKESNNNIDSNINNLLNHENVESDSIKFSKKIKKHYENNGFKEDDNINFKKNTLQNNLSNSHSSKELNLIKNKNSSNINNKNNNAFDKNDSTIEKNNLNNIYLSSNNNSITNNFKNNSTIVLKMKQNNSSINAIDNTNNNENYNEAAYLKVDRLYYSSDDEKNQSKCKNKETRKSFSIKNYNIGNENKNNSIHSDIINFSHDENYSSNMAKVKTLISDENYYHLQFKNKDLNINLNLNGRKKNEKQNSVNNELKNKTSKYYKINTNYKPRNEKLNITLDKTKSSQKINKPNIQPIISIQSLNDYNIKNQEDFPRNSNKNIKTDKFQQNEINCTENEGENFSLNNSNDTIKFFKAKKRIETNFGKENKEILIKQNIPVDVKKFYPEYNNIQNSVKQNNKDLGNHKDDNFLERNTKNDEENYKNMFQFLQEKIIFMESICLNKINRYNLKDKNDIHFLYNERKEMKVLKKIKILCEQLFKFKGFRNKIEHKNSNDYKILRNNLKIKIFSYSEDENETDYDTLLSYEKNKYEATNNMSKCFFQTPNVFHLENLKVRKCEDFTIKNKITNDISLSWDLHNFSINNKDKNQSNNLQNQIFCYKEYINKNKNGSMNDIKFRNKIKSKSYEQKNNLKMENYEENKQAKLNVNQTYSIRKNDQQKNWSLNNFINIGNILNIHYSNSNNTILNEKLHDFLSNSNLKTNNIYNYQHFGKLVNKMDEEDKIERKGYFNPFDVKYQVDEQKYIFWMNKHKKNFLEVSKLNKDDKINSEVNIQSTKPINNSHDRVLKHFEDNINNQPEIEIKNKQINSLAIKISSKSDNKVNQSSYTQIIMNPYNKQIKKLNSHNNLPSLKSTNHNIKAKKYFDFTNMNENSIIEESTFSKNESLNKITQKNNNFKRTKTLIPVNMSKSQIKQKNSKKLLSKLTLNIPKSIIDTNSCMSNLLPIKKKSSVKFRTVLDLLSVNKNKHDSGDINSINYKDEEHEKDDSKIINDSLVKGFKQNYIDSINEEKETNNDGNVLLMSSKDKNEFNEIEEGDFKINDTSKIIKRLLRKTTISNPLNNLKRKITTKKSNINLHALTISNNVKNQTHQSNILTEKKSKFLNIKKSLIGNNQKNIMELLENKNKEYQNDTDKLVSLDNFEDVGGRVKNIDNKVTSVSNKNLKDFFAGIIRKSLGKINREDKFEKKDKLLNSEIKDNLDDNKLNSDVNMGNKITIDNAMNPIIENLNKRIEHNIDENPCEISDHHNEEKNLKNKHFYDSRDKAINKIVQNKKVNQTKNNRNAIKTYYTIFSKLDKIMEITKIV